MPTTKPTKPSITLPSAFGTSVSNVKTPFTAQELIDGYSASIQQVLDGGNVNWLNDTMFKFLTYTTAICDWLNGVGTGRIPYINSSNQLDSFNIDESFNGKVDLNAANLSTAGKSLISGLGMPSNTYDDITLLASGQTYTAPANGYFELAMLHGSSTNEENVSLKNFLGGTGDWGDGILSRCYCRSGNSSFGTYIHAKKGDIVSATYNASGGTLSFRFYYAKGSESEAS